MKRSLTKLGYCGSWGCTHAYIVSPMAAEVILNTDSCKDPLDAIYGKLCKNDLNCTKVENYNTNGENWGEGIIWQNRKDMKGFHHSNNSLNENYMKDKIEKFGES